MTTKKKKGAKPGMPKPDSVEKPALFRRSPLFIACFVLMFLAILFSYSDVGKFGYIKYDDNEYVTENYAIQNGISFKSIEWCFSAVHSNNWHPITWISHLIDYSIFGNNPSAFHLINLAFHLINVFLLFMLLYLMTRSRWPALFVAALFALHPAHVESVAWIAERKDMLSSFFMFLAIIYYFFYTKLGPRKHAHYFLSLVFFALGLMSKPMLVTLPFVLLLLDYWPLGRLSRKPAIWIEKIPFLALSAASSIATYWAQNIAGAVKSIHQYSMSLRLENAVLSVGRYIVKLFWPNPLVIFYAYRDPVPVPAIIASLLGILVLTFFFYRERKTKKYLLAGWLWFLGTLVPVIGIVQVGSQSLADRYTYIPYIGLGIIVAWWSCEMLARLKKHEVLYPALIVLLVAAQAPLTKVQAAYWEDPISLFEHSLKYEKGSPVILDNLGLSYRDKGQDSKAIECYREALAIDPIFFAALGDLGNALYRKGDTEEAIQCFKRAIEANPMEPNLFKAYSNLGIAALMKKDFSEAVACFEKVKELNPGFPMVYENLGLALYQLGRTDEALDAYERGLAINPNDSNIYNNMGVIYWSKGERDKAHDCFVKAVQLNPDNQDAATNLRQFQ